MNSQKLYDLKYKVKQRQSELIDDAKNGNYSSNQEYNLIQDCIRFFGIVLQDLEELKHDS